MAPAAVEGAGVSTSAERYVRTRSEVTWRSTRGRRALNASSRLMASAHDLRPAHDEHRRDDERALEKLLNERIDPGQIENVREHANDQRAEERAGHRALAAEQRRAADDNRRDGVQFIALARDRRADAELRRVDEAREPRQKAGDDIDDRRVGFDGHAGKPRRLLVGADGVDRPPERRQLKDEAADDESRNQNEGRDWNPAK